MASRLSQNIFSLVTLKGIDYLLNFLMLPFLLRTLGAERFGAIVFTQSIVQYFVLIVDYGFNMTAPRDIARAKDQSEIARIFSSVMSAKLIMLGAISIFSLLAIETLDSIVEIDLLLFLATFPIAIGNLMFPVWFFQGIQQMKYITISSTIARASILILLFATVKSPEDYLTAAFLQSCFMLIAGILSLGIILKSHRYVFVIPKFSEIRQAFSDGWQIFISTVAINLYTTTNTVVLGALTSNSTVGFFSAAMKLIDAVKGLMSAISQAVYPHVSAQKDRAVRFIWKFGKIFVGLFLGISIGTFFGAEFIVQILFGDGYDESVLILKILAWLPFVISISNVCGIQTMLNFGKQREFSLILIGAALLDLTAIFPATLFHGAIGVAWISLGVEIFVSVIMIFYVHHARLLRE